MVKDLGAAGLAAVWARENTREAIWDAMVRKEVFATTGTRLRVRIFGGWDFKGGGGASARFRHARATLRGVPMGGDLTDAPEGVRHRASWFVHLRDAGWRQSRPNVQVIKGWLDKEG